MANHKHGRGLELLSSAYFSDGLSDDEAEVKVEPEEKADEHGESNESELFPEMNSGTMGAEDFKISDIIKVEETLTLSDHESQDEWKYNPISGNCKPEKNGVTKNSTHPDATSFQSISATLGTPVLPENSTSVPAYEGFRIKEEILSDNGTEDSEPDSPSSSGSESSDMESDFDSDESNSTHTQHKSSSDNNIEKPNRKDKRKPPMVKGELNYEDLPPIEDLHISVPPEKAKPIGIIKSFVDPLVVVEAFPGTPALDIDSVLFLDQGERALGAIFDVLGPVKQPFYCVRFNSMEHIESKGISPGMLVYCAPSTPHTSYVLVAQLAKMKGTDSSWLNDHETPSEYQDFSDDEEERANKKGQRRKPNKDESESSPSTSGNAPRKILRANPRTSNSYGTSFPRPPFPPGVFYDPSWHTHPKVHQGVIRPGFCPPPLPPYSNFNFSGRHPGVQQPMPRFFPPGPRNFIPHQQVPPPPAPIPHCPPPPPPAVRFRHPFVQNSSMRM